MSSPWFHAPQLPFAGMILALDRDEAKHAVGVRRLSSGDAVTIFDGMGGIAHAVLTGDRNSDGGVLARVDRVERISRTGTDLLVGVAPPKGDRFSTMLDMLGQLGVTGIVPLDTDHGVICGCDQSHARGADLAGSVQAEQGRVAAIDRSGHDRRKLCTSRSIKRAIGAHCRSGRRVDCNMHRGARGDCHRTRGWIQCGRVRSGMHCGRGPRGPWPRHPPCGGGGSVNGGGVSRAAGRVNGAHRSRTGNLRLAKAALFQLS